MMTISPVFIRTLEDAQHKLAKLRRLYDGLTEILREADVHRFDYVSYREVCRDLAVREIDAARAVETLEEVVHRAARGER